MVSIVDPLSIQPSHMTLAAAVGMGLLASLNMCAVVRLPVLAAYVAGAGASRRHALILTGLFILGLAGGTMLLGLTATPVADGVHRTLQVNKYSFWVLGSCLIVLGVLISGLTNPPLVPEKWRKIGERLAKANLPGAVLLGLAFGLLQVPACPTCRAELLAVANAVPAGGLAFHGLPLLIGFAAGQCLVALGVGTLTGLLKPGLIVRLRTRMCSIEERMQLLMGDMLVVLGVYFMIVG
jgi:cytochrome c biogenesis protein CcdA